MAISASNGRCNDAGCSLKNSLARQRSTLLLFLFCYLYSAVIASGCRKKKVRDQKPQIIKKIRTHHVKEISNDPDSAWKISKNIFKGAQKNNLVGVTKAFQIKAFWKYYDIMADSFTFLLLVKFVRNAELSPGCHQTANSPEKHSA